PVDVDLDEATRSVVVTREFMSCRFGGARQGLWPTIGGHRDHNYTFLYPTLEANPDAPCKPGDVGLLYRTVPTVPWGNAVLKVMIKLKSPSYLYVGDYQTVETDPLTAEEYQCLPLKTKKAWAKLVTRRQKSRDIRARIKLRKTYHREPTVDEIENILATRDEIRLSDEDVIEAYSVGLETFYIWQFKCVGYDEAFQREV
ncbi:hypothetical protein K474DRAFT_1565497, partial [Panus rudis PR-1116 ss-1]